ncbi:asparagine synthase-related protein [Henriciella aquimarina]|uniref:asparagine synthase-related protein n=1 Tax=Henriciella aquimarina TaxID=545261 RepID=UPI00117A452C
MRELFDHSYERDFLHPLISQPLIDLSLRLPTYRLCVNGISRGLARLAFKDAVPDPIRHRMTKAGATHYFIDFLDSNRPKILDALGNGELVQHGLIRREDVDTFLSGDRIRIQSLGRMALVYYSIEAWLRTWRSALRAPSGTN